MLATRVFPTLLCRDGGLWKGVRFRDHRYIGDVLNAVRIYNLHQADELALLDIGATAEGRCISADLVQKVSTECMMPLSVGGGIRKPDQALKLLQCGAEKVTLCSHALTEPGLVCAIAAAAGSQAVTVSVDSRRTPDGDRVFTHNGSRDTGLSVEEALKRMEGEGAGEILLNAIDRDGTCAGFDLDLIALAARTVSVPIIALGGGWTLEHIAQAVKAGASAVSCGSMFVFYGRRKGVLVHFPKREELEAALAS